MLLSEQTYLLMPCNRKLIGLPNCTILSNICCWHYLDIILKHCCTWKKTMTITSPVIYSKYAFCLYQRSKVFSLHTQQERERQRLENVVIHSHQHMHKIKFQIIHNLDPPTCFSNKLPSSGKRKYKKYITLTHQSSMYNVKMFLVKINSYAIPYNAAVCIQTFTLGIFNPDGWSPCALYSYV
jgi:hypothetical protein